MAFSIPEPASTPLSRRAWLHRSQAGLGLSLAGLWQAQAQAKPVEVAGLPPIKSCIIVFYYGGPSHLDTYDLKPNAPLDVRGEFQPIATSAPGVLISEHLPHMARCMHKVALIRSMHHENRLHDSASTETLTGRQSPVGDREEFGPIKQFFPSYGSTLNYLRRDPNVDVPHAALPFVFHNVIDVPCQGGGFLGTSFDPLQISVDPVGRQYRAGALTVPEGQRSTVIGDRRRLLESLEQRSLAEAKTAVGRRWQLFTEKAYQLIGSEKLHQSLDLSHESQATRERYGLGTNPVGGEYGFAWPMRGQNLLLARRLVEAGVPFINTFDFQQQGQNWDTHAKNFELHKKFLLPQTDQSLSALIDDLDDRGLLESTLVVALGEFGRTPKINANAGRDHWPDCYSVVMAGGGIRGGSVLGSSDRLGMHPATEPVTPADLAATIYWRFGIDPTTEVQDLTGRPWRIADGHPMRSLFA